MSRSYGHWSRGGDTVRGENEVLRGRLVSDERNAVYTDDDDNRKPEARRDDWSMCENCTMLGLDASQCFAYHQHGVYALPRRFWCMFPYEIADEYQEGYEVSDD